MQSFLLPQFRIPLKMVHVLVQSIFVCMNFTALSSFYTSLLLFSNGAVETTSQAKSPVKLNQGVHGSWLAVSMGVKWVYFRTTNEISCENASIVSKSLGSVKYTYYSAVLLFFHSNFLSLITRSASGIHTDIMFWISTRVVMLPRPNVCHTQLHSLLCSVPLIKALTCFLCA